MKLSRLLSAVLAAVFALCLVAAASASAAAPVFNTTKDKVTSKSGAGVLEHTLTGEKIECTGDSSKTGEVTSTNTVGHIQVIFTGCKGKNGSTTCKAKSTGATGAEEIITSTVKGTLGESKESKTGVGILFEPESGTKFTEVEGSVSGCLTKAEVKGTVAGEITPINTTSKTGKIVFTGAAGSQSIKNITVNGSNKKPKLEALSGFVEVSENTTEEVNFEQNIVVT
jgi:hypothetical protein